MAYTVYRHISPSGKSYIGYTKNKLTRRWGNGTAYKECPKFNQAIQKYGWNNFHHETLDVVSSKEEAEQKEKEYIALFHSDDSNYGYNTTKGGAGTLGLRHTELAKEKMSIAKKGKVSNRKGKKHTDEAKAKMSAAKKGRPAHNKGIPLSDSQKNKIREAQSKRVMCVETQTIYKSINEASNAIGRSRSGISLCLNGCQDTCGGFHWITVGG